ncbi:MAG: AAC(3) family N-acetyltransferase [Candidatus Promineifilaceae bacterium]
MSEKDAIKSVEWPNTRKSIAEDLRRLGLQPGMTVLVHSSLSKIGYVVAGAVSVIYALQDVLTPEGTLVMPAHTGDYSDPAEWQNPPVPAVWHEHIRQNMPLFDPARTPTRNMGAIPELFRTWPDVVRSSHPSVSFAAWGHYACQITGNHALEFGLGEGSPLARIYELDGYVLLLGVGYNRNTSMHLGEVRAGVRRQVLCGAPMLVNGRSRWTTYREIDYDDEPFPQIGTEMEVAGLVTRGYVGKAECRLFSQRTAVDFTEAWLQR